MGNEEEGASLARNFRDARNLSSNPIVNILDVVRDAGYDVVVMPAEASEHGLSMKNSQTGRCVIAVAATEHPMRQRSSVAHELGHILAGDLDSSKPFTPGKRSSPEVRADAFARHLLFPVEAISGALPEKNECSLKELSDVVRTFGVSPQLASIQLRDAGRITNSTQRQWMAIPTRTLATQFGWLSDYADLARASTQYRAPQLLIKRSIEGVERGVLGINELAYWYQQSAEDLEPIISQPESDMADDDLFDFSDPLFKVGD